MSCTRIYFLLGVPGSGRRGVLADLIEHGVPDREGVGILLPDAEAGHPDDEKLLPLASAGLERISGKVEKNLPFAGNAVTLFVILPGLSNPIDRLEEWKNLLSSQRKSLELGRILTVVDCGFLSKNPGAAGWYEACIHFSDAVLLNHRADAGNRWIGEFEKAFRKAHFPCLFEPVRKGGVRNPAAILTPEPRRLSQAFDFWEEEIDGLYPSLEFEVEIEDESPGGLLDAEDEEDAIPVDPYFARMPGGRRRRKIPDIRKFFPSQPT